MPIRLSCRISSVAHQQLAREIARLRSNKGRTLVQLMELVRDPANFDHAINATFGNDAQIACTLNIADPWLESFSAYRTHHGLYENTSFFRSAILRGLSIRLDELQKTTA